eukprot:Gregarina_sp_Poly_1__11364@NODE_959_length_5551_cov_11_991247_g679_i0_p3_GENE_NODE_959_length_5551_cov_11_991247_g679_i0NODE_959_length_5551_cov_11_991247_g679_i0_p3_ORF_typecomplete_len130_score30_57_NODE_959_length_5551_cov_11_991247_g679_i030733462
MPRSPVRSSSLFGSSFAEGIKSGPPEVAAPNTETCTTPGTDLSPDTFSAADQEMLSLLNAFQCAIQIHANDWTSMAPPAAVEPPDERSPWPSDKLTNNWSSAVSASAAVPVASAAAEDPIAKLLASLWP